MPALWPLNPMDCGPGPTLALATTWPGRGGERGANRVDGRLTLVWDWGLAATSFGPELSQELDNLSSSLSALVS